MGGPRFPAAMAAHINELFNPFVPVQAGDIITAAALTSIHELLGYSLADPGECILVARPFYGRFELDFGNTSNLNLVYVDMDGVDPFLQEAVPRYQEVFDQSQAAGLTIKAVLIVNPHNPLGKISHHSFKGCLKDVTRSPFKSHSPANAPSVSTRRRLPAFQRPALARLCSSSQSLEFLKLGKVNAKRWDCQYR